MIILYILFKLPMPDKKNLQTGFRLFFTYSKMQLLTGIIDSFLAWETWYIIQLFHIVSQQRIKTALKVFSCEFSEISKNNFFTEHVWAIPSGSLTVIKDGKNICREGNYFYVNFLALYLVFALFHYDLKVQPFHEIFNRSTL